ncbi:MAG: transporter substrate-binding domain-containing protein, partial [Bacteroidia bacterium]
MKHSLLFLLLFKAIIYLAPNQVLAADTLTVGIKPAPPFVIKDGENWRGLTVDIWEHIAAENQFVTQYKELSMDQMTNQLTNSQIDIGLGAVTVSTNREKQFDFSNAYYPSGLGILFKKDEATAIKIAMNLVSGNFIKAILLLCLVLLGVGFIIWLAEKRKNPDEFEGGIKGVLSGFWWSAVTMTTVGYGDKSPKT